MHIDPKDVIVETVTTGSGWFPRFNGIKLTHIPTSTIVVVHSNSSLWANRAEAFNRLTIELSNPQQMELDLS